MREKYCVYCGQKLDEVKTGFFDSQTGEPTYYKRCNNLKCPANCSQCNHKFGWFSNKCKLCGCKKGISMYE